MNERINSGDSPSSSPSVSGKEAKRAGKISKNTGESAARRKTSSGKKSPGNGSGSQNGKIGSGGRTGNSRRENKLSPSLSTLLSWLQVSHLEGLSKLHKRDVEMTREFKRRFEVVSDHSEARLLRLNTGRLSIIPPDELQNLTLKEIRQQYPALISDIEKKLAEDRLVESFFKGIGDRPELVQSYWFGDAGAGYVSLQDGHGGSAVSLPGAEWEHLIRKADAVRHTWRDPGGKIRKSKALREAEKKNLEHDEHGMLPKMSGQLHKIYARIPPWVGGVAASELSPRELKEIIQEVAEGFSRETGFRVLSANIHRESSYDLHIHLVYTDLVVVEREEEPYKPETLRKMLGPLKKVAKSNLVRSESPSSKVDVEVELERMFEAGEAEDPRKLKTTHEYQRIELPEHSREHLVAMGPAYISKTWLWEKSGRDERVAAVNEQSGHHFTFKSIVMGAAKREIAPKQAKGAEDVYIDYWLSKKWTEAVMGRISEPGKNEIALEARASVERYVDAGRSLPEPFSRADLDLRARKLKEAEEARAAAVRAEKDALAAEAAALAAKNASEAAQAAADRFVQEALEPPTLEQVAEKMEFKQQEGAGETGFIRVPEGGGYAQRLIITGRKFVRSIPELGRDKPQEGEGAVELLATEDTLKTVKRTKLQLLSQLVAWFPTRALAIINEALGARGGEVVKQLLGLDRADVVPGKVRPPTKDAKQAAKPKDKPGDDSLG